MGRIAVGMERLVSMVQEDRNGHCECKWKELDGISQRPVRFSTMANNFAQMGRENKYHYRHFSAERYSLGATLGRLLFASVRH